MISMVMPTSQSPLAEPSLRWMYGLSLTVKPRLRRICWNCCCLLSPRSMAYANAWTISPRLLMSAHSAA
ncbi:hypothetical protein NCPPB2254_00730 [Pseudomonas syringae pv. persicae]|uniref:Uncharacterized protein n=1 Tax=Pseudomonas syringae pv. persicae TaxID=237306 RepID=A0AB38EBD0_9PSED|nr:hypothetical protein NCPPB2254_00730 [Pseudomonas syringae pv. persicae]